MKNTIIICFVIVAVLAVGCTKENPVINSFEDCIRAGNPVMESYPRQCYANGQTFTEEINGKIQGMTEEYCKSGGGNWNECSNRCMLENQGKEGVACTMQCEQLCECGGIAGFGCPEGYYCNLPESGIMDALGYCDNPSIDVHSAKAIAEASDCVKDGSITGEGYYNPNSKTWWFDIEMNPGSEHEGCSPACVVSSETQTAEINWRCTGLIPE